jgi:hypothetical protein
LSLATCGSDTSLVGLVGFEGPIKPFTKIFGAQIADPSLVNCRPTHEVDIFTQFFIGTKFCSAEFAVVVVPVVSLLRLEVSLSRTPWD